MNRVFMGMVVGAALLTATVSRGDGQMIEDFEAQPETRWVFISDQVMGGVSSGRVMFRPDGPNTVMQLQGDVSTQNNGGFIQARLTLNEPLPSEARGLELRVRGNGQTYFIHTQTNNTIIP